MKYSLIFTIILMNLLAGCKKNDCNENILLLKHFENDYGCLDTKHSLAIDLQNNMTIVRSKADYDAKVTGDCHPEIDFLINDLVIGKQASGNWIDTIMYDLKNCSEKDLTLTVKIIQTALTLPDNVVYHAIIPKLGDEENLKVVINVK